MKGKTKYPKEKFKELLEWDLKNHSDGVFGYLYLRRSSVAIVRLLSPLPITPNFISLCSVIFALFSLVVLYYRIPLGNLWSAVFIQISLILGYVDGDYARLKNVGSKFGGWLDGLADITKINIVYFALAIGEFVQSKDLNVFILLSLLLSTRMILAHIGSQTRDFFLKNNKGSRVEDFVSGGLRKKLVGIFKIDPVYFTFSDDVKFVLITLLVISKQFLFGIIFFSILHLFLSFFSIYNVWKIGKNEVLGDDGWKIH